MFVLVCGIHEYDYFFGERPTPNVFHEELAKMHSANFKRVKYFWSFFFI